MSSISSITKAVSGLNAAQKGLQVTAHNISNVNTDGYTRQHLLQSESPYQTIGKSGTATMQVGLGVTCDEIRQTRDELADKRFRTESSVLNYYQKLNGTVSDIESMFDEPYGSTVSQLINNFWSQAQKLSTTANGVEERQSFISSAKVLMTKINSITDSLKTYQEQLNNEVIGAVDKINGILDRIKECNDKVSMEIATGENANDYRDERNKLLDELSQYGEIRYIEQSDRRIYVEFEGHTVVDKGFVTHLELEQTQPNTPFKAPIWSDTGSRVYPLKDRVTAASETDTGLLKALLVARGNSDVTVDTNWNDVALNDNLSVDVEGNAFVIPKIQMMLNQFTNQLTTLVNDNFKGTGTGDQIGKDGVPVFVPKNVPSHLASVKSQIAKGDYTGLTSAQIDEYNQYLIGGNVEVNPTLLTKGGYNSLGTVSKAPVGSDAATAEKYAGNVGDNSLVKKFLEEFGVTQKWNERNPASGAGAAKTAPFEKTSTLVDFFSETVTDIGTQGSLFSAKAQEKNISITNLRNERQAIGGVSTDEEFSYMLRYQYAYNASSRMITMLDGMLDTIINRM